MVVTTHQPIFLPWSGFFYKAFCADALVLLDNVQFPLGRSWMTRNRLKNDKGELWLSVPVWKKGRGMQSIRSVEICDEKEWRRKHLLSLSQQYSNAPYREDYLPTVEEIYHKSHRLLVDLNIDLITFFWRVLGLKSRRILQSQLGVCDKGTDLLISVCRALNADTYLSLPSAEKHLDVDKFRRNGIRLVFARLALPVYPQLWGEFRYNLSALDLLLNCGPKSLEIIGHSTSNIP
ncbi:MAG: WbqC family protein [Gammaproteobacteria bacterium]|nr:WbqC family protein [Gammaproteobacteria bacterium]